MRSRAVWLAAVVLIGLLGFCPPSHAQQEPTNLLTNGGFEDGVTAPWGIHGGSTMEVVTQCAGATVAEKPKEGKYCLHVVATQTANWWNTAISQGGIVFQKGKKYTLSAYLKCKKGTAQINFKPELGVDPWTGYGEQQFTMTEEWAEYSITTPVFSADVTPTDITFHIGFAATEFWMDAIRFYEGDYAPAAFLKRFSADEPGPEDGATDVPQDVALSWESGPFAATHNVYFGTTFEDANNATVAGPLGAQVSAGQTQASYDPAGLLEFGKTYYWRVDEVNAPPDATIYKGNVWSFTVEPYTYPIRNIIATASSADKATTGPEKTVNGSGLNADDLHSTASSDMWVSKFNGPQPTWIQYQFDKAYSLSEMWVWNYNMEFEPVLGYGFKDVTIEYSLDGTNWTKLSDVQFAQATAQSSYAHNNTVDLGGITAQYIRLTANSNWSLVGLKQYGLSEVRFFYVPVQAREPQPAAGAEGVALDTPLSWRPGRKAASHKVYFSHDRQAVVDGTAPADTVTANSYQPAALEYGKTYYWKVDEVNEASAYAGDIWSFSATEFFVVDDFESYNDEEGKGTRIYETWIDGYADSSSGSMVGNLQMPFAEQTIVHEGAQSMPMDYNNINAPHFSEAYREFAPVQDWTVPGVTDLILWVQGSRGQMAPVTETGGKMTVTGEGTDIWDVADEFTFVYKTLSGDGALIARVTSKGSGSNTWAKGGVMIRDGLAAGAAHAMMVLTANSDGTAGNGASFQWRPSADGATSNSDAQTVINAPYYVKIERKGESLSGAVSPDGNSWTAVGSPQYISMAAPAYIGFCVTSHAAGEDRTFVFENIKATGAGGSWQTKEIGLARNSVETLYVVVEDSSGKSAVATNPDLVTAGQWTEWRIPLSSLTGVNLAKVKKMYLGVGDRKNPQAGGAGRIYIDDIRVGCRGLSNPGTGQ